MTRQLVTCAALATALLLGAGSAGAAPGSTTTTAGGTPQGKLAREGYHLYGEYCLGCHGPNAAGRLNQPPYSTGAGPGRAQRRQGGIAPSLHGVGALAADFYLRTGYMPLQHVGQQPSRQRLILNERQIQALVAYVASLGGPAIPKPRPDLGNISQGQALFTEHCAGCHQIVAQGGYVTGALPPPLDKATDTEIAEAVRIGPYVMPKFSRRAISDRELASIISYVDFTRHPYHPGGWGIGFIGPVPEGITTWFLAIPALIVLCLLLGRRLRSS